MDEAAVNKAFEATQKEFQQVDVLISNAGILPPGGPTTSEDLEGAWKGFEVNVKGTMIVTRAFLGVAPKTGAVLINMSTGIAHLIAPTMQAYGASKAAAAIWLSYVQSEYKGLRVISISPGIVATDMQAHTKDDFPAEDTRKCFRVA